MPRLKRPWLMRISKLEIEGFRGISNDQTILKDLTVFYGPMGTGKTSRLLAILFALTGGSVANLTQEDLINVESDFTWVRITGVDNGKSFTITRRKARGKPSSYKSDLDSVPEFSERIYIEGREISKLFVGPPAEKVWRIDYLLGLERYNELLSQVSTAHLEKKLDDMERARSSVHEAESVRARVEKIQSELRSLRNELQTIHSKIEGERESWLWAEDVLRRSGAHSIRVGEIHGKQAMIERYKGQLEALAQAEPSFEESLMELESKFEAMKRRITFLEAAMQTLDLGGKSVEETRTCPLCGASLSGMAIEQFRHHDEEYRSLIPRMGEFEGLLIEKRKQRDRLRADEERRKFLGQLIANLVAEVRAASLESIPVDDVQKAKGLIETREKLQARSKELGVRISSLEEQLDALSSVQRGAATWAPQQLDERIHRLAFFIDRVKRVKAAIGEALAEARASQMENISISFSQAFRKIYPHSRFSDVDFGTATVRGREVLMVKARVDGHWVYAHQMSTGESVAISFALLFAVNALEKSPILLLDEPEEGLDEMGIAGLAGVLKNLKETTQVLIATRSKALAEQLGV